MTIESAGPVLTLTGERYGAARLAATEFRMASAVRQKLQQQFGAWERYGMQIPADLQAWFDGQEATLGAVMATCLKMTEAAWAGTAIADFQKATTGLGPTLFVILSLTPELDRFPNPAKLWKYLGLAADRASVRKYSKQLKAWCLFRLAEPAVKMAGGERTNAKTGLIYGVARSPYRDVYDARRQSRPEMLPEGEGCEFCDMAYAKRKATKKNGWDCHNMGGPHWKPAHAHVDALGVTAKAILLDAWRIAHGMDPKHGSM